MTDDRLSGLALIAGSGGMIITMSLHPTGHVAADQVESMIHMLIAVHALALACVPVQFLGAWGLSRRVASPNHLAVTGLVLYTFALLAVINAAVADGLVMPSLLRQIVASAGLPQAIDGWRMMSRYNFYVNQAYAQVFVAASSVAIVLWSASTWHSRELARGLAILRLHPRTGHSARIVVRALESRRPRVWPCRLRPGGLVHRCGRAPVATRQPSSCCPTVRPASHPECDCHP
jgi:hypothetical protein